MYPFEVGLGVIAFVFPNVLIFFLSLFVLQQIFTTCENKLSWRTQNTNSPDVIHTEELPITQLVENAALLLGITSLVFAFFVMYYMLFVRSRLINNQNPLQGFLSYLLPTEVFTAIMWGIRSLQTTKNKRNGDTEHLHESRGADSNDEDGPVQARRMKKFMKKMPIIVVKN